MPPEDDPKSSPQPGRETHEQSTSGEGRRTGRGRRGRGRHRKRRSGPPEEGIEKPGPAPQGEREQAEPQPQSEHPPLRDEARGAAPEFAPGEEFHEEEPFAEEPPFVEPAEPQHRAPAPVELRQETTEAGPPATLQQAIDQVNDIVETLRQSLDQMEELLEFLEVLERQNSADQHEIDSMRRALRQLHRPRDGAHGHHR